MPYEVGYAQRSIANLRSLTARQRSIIFDGIQKQLTEEPTNETRNRKPLRSNQIATWELRLGNLRVYYDVEGSIVIVQAVGVKIRENVRIGDEDYGP